MKTITLKVEDCDQVIIDELKGSYHMFNQLDKAVCSNDVIEPDYGLLKAIQTVLEYYMPHDDWVKWMEKNPIWDVQKMIKALLIVSAMAGIGQYTTELPSMDECLKARQAILQQDANIKTLCIPKMDESVQMRRFFDIFMDMIDQIKTYDEVEGGLRK